MKKKVFIIVGLILSLSLIGGSLAYKAYKENKKLKEEKKTAQIIANTKKEYGFYLKNEIKENPTNKTEKLFNEVILESNKNNSIDFASFSKNNLVKDLNNANIEEIISTINLEEEKYPLNSLEEIASAQISNNSQSNDVNKTILSIYKKHKFIKNLEQEKQKRQEYLNNLNTLKEELTYFRNSQDYSVKDGIYLCKNEDIQNKLKDFSTKYNLNLNITLENTKIEIKDRGVPILCYHGILDEPWGQTNLFVKVADFDAQMQYLHDNGYTPIFASEIKTASNVSKPIIITFDDGYKDVYTNAFPILKKYNIKANIYMISGWIGGDVYMNEQDLKEMSQSPLIEVGSHTVSHKALATLDENQIETELKDSQKTLQEMTGKKIDVIAYPTGSFDERVVAIAQKYYKYGLSTIKGKENPLNLNTYSLRRIYVYRNYNLNTFKGLF